MIFLTDLILFKRGCHPNIYVCQMIDLPGQGMSVEAKECQVTEISQDDTVVLIQVSRIFQQVLFHVVSIFISCSFSNFFHANYFKQTSVQSWDQVVTEKKN